jgi:Protein of unknown function (DUF742)
MAPRAVDRETPDRLYTVTKGRTLGDDSPFDLVSLIVREQPPSAGMQSEHVKILRICRHPTSVVELAAELELPVSVIKVLLLDLLDEGSITVRHPVIRRRRTEREARPVRMQLPDPEMLKQVLIGLQRL